MLWNPRASRAAVVDDSVAPTTSGTVPVDGGGALRAGATGGWEAGWPGRPPDAGVAPAFEACFSGAPSGRDVTELARVLGAGVTGRPLLAVATGSALAPAAVRAGPPPVRARAVTTAAAAATATAPAA